MGIVTSGALQLAVRLDIAFAAQQPDRLESNQFVRVLTQPCSRNRTRQAMAITAQLYLGLGIPIVSPHGELRRNEHRSRLTHMFAGRAMAFFAVHVGDEAHDLLVDDIALSGVTVHTLVHHFVLMFLPE